MIKIIFLNCRERYEGMNDHHIFYIQLIKQLWNWGVKKPKTLSHCESVTNTYMQKVKNANEYLKDHIFELQRKIFAWFIIQHSYTHNLMCFFRTDTFKDKNYEIMTFFAMHYQFPQNSFSSRSFVRFCIFYLMI